ncbi:ATP synthase subunit 4 mitochondrial precursor [Dimargaris cristalligena]|uniref:ATP synthase subunit 4 n=1 Tax=Dimargaris cristalligena TaxID=215637 RepID=A0A4P9ZPD8_9FUNG|nr:ATP synthase subunit 4 mitochondrial precursor [Dimargaris cristalligena]|eukprot:RKP35095.1 ATP synthase subunit 4 mitochondrial precursor [Dimargaris cristalligena]
MAHKLATQRLAGSIRPLATSTPRVALAARTFSSSASNQNAVKVEEPEKKANSIIDALPGNSLLSKTGILTVGASAAAFLVSKEIYVINEETVALIATVGLLSVLYKIGREPYNEFAQGYIQNMVNIFNDARKEHRAAVQSRIDQVAELKDIVQVTKDMFQMSKDMAQMEAQIFELKQRVAFSAEAKSVLDSWVRHEANLREREQRELATSVIEQSRQELMKPEVQNQILEQCISEVEQLSAKRA